MVIPLYLCRAGSSGSFRAVVVLQGVLRLHGQNKSKRIEKLYYFYIALVKSHILICMYLICMYVNIFKHLL